MKYRLLSHKILLLLFLLMPIFLLAHSVEAQDPCLLTPKNCKKEGGNKSDGTKGRKDRPKVVRGKSETPVTAQSVSGQIRGLDDKGISGVTVTAYDKNGVTLFPNSTTDVEGKYTLSVKNNSIGKVIPRRDGYKFRPSSSSTIESSFEAIPLCIEKVGPKNKPLELSPNNTSSGEQVIIPHNSGCDPTTQSSSPYYYHEYKLKLKDKESFSLKVETPSGVLPRDFFAVYIVDKDGVIEKTMSVAGEKIEGIKGEFVRVAIITPKKLNNGEEIPLPFKYSIKLTQKGLTVAGYQEKLKNILGIRIDQIEKYDKGFYEKLSKLLGDQKEISKAIQDLELLKKADVDGDVSNLRRIGDELLLTLYIHSNPIKTGEALNLFKDAIKSGAVVRVFGEVRKVDKNNRDDPEFKGKWLLIKASGDIEIVQENSKTLITHRSDEVIGVDPNPKNIKSILKLDIKTEYETCSYLLTNAVQDGSPEFTSFVKSLFDELLPKKAQPQKQKKR
jgi:hypothetical protein